MNEALPNAGSQPVIDSLLKRLSKSPLKERITVFGSVARGSNDPRDLDIWVDMKDREIGFDVGPQVQFFLALAKAFPGYLDPFVQFKSTTIVRNADCNDWTGAKFAKKIRNQVEKEGIPLDAALLQRGLVPATAPAGSPKP